MGYYVYMDDNGDVEGNYSLVALCEVNAWKKSMHSVNSKNGENKPENPPAPKYDFPPLNRDRI